MSADTTQAGTVQYACPYCRLASQPGGVSCPHCGAPVDVRELVDDAGWVELPGAVDMARIQLGASKCQIAGTYVPVAEMSLAPQDSVYFSHHVLLWTEPGTQLSRMSMAGGWSRVKGGMPLVMMEATGPGVICFSDDAPGEIVAVPLQPGCAIDVSEHHFLVATSTAQYESLQSWIWFTTNSGNDTEWHYPLGRYLDRFHSEVPALLLLHAQGNCFIRDLSPGQRIFVQPRSLLYKDASIRMYLHFERPGGTPGWGLKWMPETPLIGLEGPGRVAIQSMYEKEYEVVYRTTRVCNGTTRTDW